jgi:hypothetical protein
MNAERILYKGWVFAGTVILGFCVSAFSTMVGRPPWKCVHKSGIGEKNGSGPKTWA